eukprot:g15366.t1
MTKGAIHPNGSNFSRGLQHDVVSRVEKLIEQGSYRQRPDWLLFCQRVPPLELHNLQLQDKKIQNPYRTLVADLLDKYPDLRFVDSFVDGNDWQQGNDVYRSDHPVMQFVARQQQLLNAHPGTLTKRQAFAQVERYFRKRRRNQEKQQKLLIAMMAGHTRGNFCPLFTNAKDVLYAKVAENQATHLRHIRRELAEMRRNKASSAAMNKASGTGAGSKSKKSSNLTVRGSELEKQRLLQLASTKQLEDVDLLLDDDLEGLHPYHSIARERRKRQQKLVIQQMQDTLLGPQAGLPSSGSDEIDVAQRLFGDRRVTKPTVAAEQDEITAEAVSLSEAMGVETEPGADAGGAPMDENEVPAVEEQSNAAFGATTSNASEAGSVEQEVAGAEALRQEDSSVRAADTGGMEQTPASSSAMAFRSTTNDEAKAQAQQSEIPGDRVREEHVAPAEQVAQPRQKSTSLASLEEKLQAHREKLQKLREQRRRLEEERDK